MSKPSRNLDSLFARRTAWNLATNRYTAALEQHRSEGRKLFDLTASNPTTIGLRYRDRELLQALANPAALGYDPQPKGLLTAREAVAAYYAEQGSRVSPDELLLTTSTSEAYTFVFRLLCNAGDAVLVPTPSYPLFDFLAEIQDVRLFPYELVYHDGWQIDFGSVRSFIERARTEGARLKALLAVHPNNPTGSYVKAHELEELNHIAYSEGIAIIADEVFLDYSLTNGRHLTFSANDSALTFTLSGLSKISGLPQMKVAWIAVSGPEESRREGMLRLEVIADTYLSMNAPVQLAVPAMLEERANVQAQLLERVRTNLSELDKQLAAQQLCARLQVEGGWYVVVRVPAIGSDEILAIELLGHHDVLVQPGHFYDFRRDGYLVLSLITPPEQFREGIRRLLQFVAVVAGGGHQEP